MGRATSTRTGKCRVCGRPCASYERNSDGSYAHATCLYPQALWPIARAPSGANLYNHPEVKK